MSDQHPPAPSIEEQTLIVGVGDLVLLAGLPAGNSVGVALGGVIIGVGLLITIVWEIVVVGANRELKKSGGVTGGLSEWLGMSTR